MAEWDQARKYLSGEVVTYLGSDYRAQHAVIGELPTRWPWEPAGGGAPSGAAGGDLAGTYPNPTIPGLPAWVTVFDLNDETDLSAFTESREGDWSFNNGTKVISWAQVGTEPESPSETLTLPVASLELTAPVLGWRFSVEARLVTALPEPGDDECLAFVDVYLGLTSILPPGNDFVQDGTLSYAGPASSDYETAPYVVGDWYTVLVSEAGALWTQQVTPIQADPATWFRTGSTGAQRIGNAVVKFGVSDVDGVVDYEIRNLTVQVLSLPEPS